MQTKQDTTSNKVDPRSRIKCRNTFSALAVLLIASFMISLNIPSQTHKSLLFYTALACLVGGIAFAFRAYFYSLDILKDAIEEKAKQYVENLDTIYADKRIIGKNLKIVLEASRYNCDGLSGNSNKTVEILARSQHERWVVIELQSSPCDADGHVYIADDDYAKQRLKHHRELYVEYFGEPEIA
jgi:hypothetical protein